MALDQSKNRPYKSRNLDIPVGIYGWFAGGSGVATYNIIDRITLASDAVNAIDACDLTVERYGLSAIADNTYCWFFGGRESSGLLDTIDRITRVADTTNAVDRANLRIPRTGHGSVTDRIYGWILGGGYANTTNDVDRMSLANDTVNPVFRCDIELSRVNLCSITDLIYAWSAGGRHWVSGTTWSTDNIIDRITLADDTTNALDRCDLDVARMGPTGFTNNIHGWFCGGQIYDSSTYYNNIDRITLADDTTNAIDRCDLTDSKSESASITNDVYAWIGGGMEPTTTNVVERITIATDTVNAIDRCDLTVSRGELSAVA